MSYSTDYFKGRERVVIDGETGSPANLKDVGHYHYFEIPETRLHCLGVALNKDPVEIRNGLTGEPFPREPVPRDTVFVAHHAAFERELVKRFFPEWDIQDNQWSCTMIRAAYYGLPMDLDKLAEALGLPFGKDKEGRKAMLRASRPTADGKFDHLDELRPTLERYCANDVSLERLVDRLIPELPWEVYDQWLLDMKMNDTGMQIDRGRVYVLQNRTENLQIELNRRAANLTNKKIQSLSQSKAIAEYCGVSGIGKDVIDAHIEAFSQFNSAAMCTKKQLLELRKEYAKSSVAKLNAMEFYASPIDNRARGMFQFYGASRTGRYAGRGPQPQNFPRPTISAGEIERRCAAPDTASLSDISSSLRSCFEASANRELVVIDFEQIEARILAWLAGQQDIVDAFAAGEDVYTLVGKKVGGDRMLGKVMQLALGYGMGKDKFRDTANKPPYNLGLDEVTAIENVTTWREKFDTTVQLWYRTERAVKHTITTKQTSQVGNENVKVWYSMEDVCGYPALFMHLPSGRCLVYREPTVEEGRIRFMGQNSLTKKWEKLETYGGKLVENKTQAIAADLLFWLMRLTSNEYITTSGTVHDEVIREAPKGIGEHFLNEVKADVARSQILLPWTKGLPLAVSGFVAERYGKG